MKNETLDTDIEIKEAFAAHPVQCYPREYP